MDAHSVGPRLPRQAVTNVNNFFLQGLLGCIGAPASSAVSPYFIPSTPQALVEPNET